MRSSIGSSIALALITVALSWLVGSCPCHAQGNASFTNPLRVSQGSAASTERPAVNVDFIEHINVAWVESGDLWVTVGPNLPGVNQPVSVGVGVPASHPQVLREGTNIATAIFQRASGVGGNDEIYYSNNLGGGFAAPFNLSQSPFDDRNPDAAIAIGGGTRHTVWERYETNPPTIVVMPALSGSQFAAGVGFNPRISAHTSGQYHLVFEREDEIFYVTGTSMGVEPEQSLSTGISTVSAPDLVADTSNVAHIVFVAENDIFYTRGTSGAFLPAMNLSNSPIAASGSPRIAVEQDTVHVVYEEQGDIHRVVIQGGIAASSVNLTNSAALESDPCIALDRFFGTHLVFRRDDNESYYATDTPLPIPDFSVDVSSGSAPLSVQFNNESQGGALTYVWDFGDGSVSFQENPSHVYESSGVFLVTLTATGPGGAVTQFVANAVTVAAPTEVMWIPPLVGKGGELLNAPVLLAHTQALASYQVSLAWDAPRMDLVETSLESTQAGLLDPDIVLPSFSDDGIEASFVLAVVFDFIPPFDGVMLQPASASRLVNLYFDVDPAAAGRSFIDLTNNVGPNPVSNIYSNAGGFSVVPVLQNNSVELLSATDPATSFIRGDANLSSGLDLADAITILNYLFLGAAAPACLDACDADDSGTLGLGDAIAILNTLFGGGTTILPPPYPISGYDPTPDLLGDC